MCGLFAFSTASCISWPGSGGTGDSTLRRCWPISERPFITVGFVAFVLMAALAATSTQWAMRRLGKRWQRLHRVVYAIGLLAVLHYWWHKAGRTTWNNP